MLHQCSWWMGSTTSTSRWVIHAPQRWRNGKRRPSSDVDQAARSFDRTESCLQDGGVLLVAATRENVSPSLVLELLKRVGGIIKASPTACKHLHTLA